MDPAEEGTPVDAGVESDQSDNAIYHEGNPKHACHMCFRVYKHHVRSLASLHGNGLRILSTEIHNTCKDVDSNGA